MNEKEFEEKLERFIETLKTTKITGYFNPWANDGGQENSANKRCNNLKKFLSKRMNAEFVLIGEAPSFGARYTRIPMTSEEMIIKYLEDKYELTSNQKPIHEDTASVVWDVINENSKKFVMWNAFAFNKNKKGDYVEPSIKDIENDKNKKIFKMFIELYPASKIIAVGRSAQTAISYAISDYVKHPSHGGANDFKKAFKKYVKLHKHSIGHIKIA